ncbi:sulfatase-like hydrolase/transferase [Paenibacillus alginolyticus]|uniref:Sulfatase-like hydrolase/transferase n=1 Tax=Paenibacillus alginolyticus TaxID=59839 RepID=A0ABT4GMT9_9BACL|nr:sulfatase-like hydrolase/transferase [Paenibacillus alginolyticus]MCY9669199.1 sulfatase-like hydrolase/transferase [Paenibacillus alginolyticus]MCY9697450.1 sulfatase-like hydrolase/transferase [Paenibacillus alginolyticus]MEC0148483.1 sulfatase-like hydrolase/transferase [Paenibacillus alginolyticus]
MSRPNILLIMADQLRYDCIGYSRSAPVETPNIDRLAAEGMWFTNAYTHIPVCGPSRQSLVCGQRPETFGGLWNHSIALKVASLEPSSYSWARTLQEAGYRCSYIGKWDVHPQHDPTRYGFDEYIDSNKYYRSWIKEKYPDLAYTQGYMGEVDPLPLEHSSTHQTAAMASELLGRMASDAGVPWLLRVNFREPHLPCRPTATFAKRYPPEQVHEWPSFGDTFIDKPYIQAQQLLNWNIQDYSWDDWAPIVSRYFAVISQLDDAIGELLRQLDATGLSDNTIVLFTADHGDMCGGHRMMDKHYVMYEDVVKVPLAVRWPGMVAPGSRCDQFVYNMLDLPPTLLEASGSPSPERIGVALHGESLLSLLQGHEPQGWRDHVVATYNGQQFGLYSQRMIRTSDWKYVWNPTDTDELYDMRADPNELSNIARHPDHAATVTELRHRLYEILLRDGDGLVQNHWMKEQLLAGRKK